MKIAASIQLHKIYLRPLNLKLFHMLAFRDKYTDLKRIDCNYAQLCTSIFFQATVLIILYNIQQCLCL